MLSHHYIINKWLIVCAALPIGAVALQFQMYWMALIILCVGVMFARFNWSVQHLLLILALTAFGFHFLVVGFAFVVCFLFIMPIFISNCIE